MTVQRLDICYCLLYTSWAYSTYNIGNKYKKLEAKLVLIDSYNTTNFDTTLYFYGDGKLLKKYRMTPSKIPFKISVNVAGVKKLKIYVKDNKAVSGGTSFGIVNCKLYKSQAPKKPVITNINKKKGVITGTTDVYKRQQWMERAGKSMERKKEYL